MTDHNGAPLDSDGPETVATTQEVGLDYGASNGSYDAENVTQRGEVLDLFAGPGGWDVAARALGIDHIVSTLTAQGLSLHGFGVKTSGLRAYGPLLFSADSMAWSFRGRRVRPPECGSTTHASEANCLGFALRWRSRLLDAKPEAAQMALEFA